MGNSWEWVGGYVQAETRADLAAAIQNTVETISDGKVLAEAATFNASSNIGTTALVSPQQSGWTAFWVLSHHLCYEVFRMQRLSGMLFHGFGEPRLSALELAKALAINPDLPESQIGILHDDENSWNYIRWQDGEMIDWFISNPLYHFEEGQASERGVLERAVIPYLQSRGEIGESEHLGRIWIGDLVSRHLDAWSGSMDSIRPLVKPSVSEEQIREWLAQSTVPALYRLPEMFEIPFVGPDYSICDMVNFLALRGGFGKPGDLFRKLEPDIEWERRYERSRKWMDVVSRTLPILFKPRGKEWERFENSWIL